MMMEPGEMSGLVLVVLLTAGPLLAVLLRLRQSSQWHLDIERHPVHS